MKQTETKAFGNLQGTDLAKQVKDAAKRKKDVAELIYGVGTKWPHHIFDLPCYNLDFRRLEKTKALVAEARFKEKKLTMVDNHIALYQVPPKGQVGQMSPSMTMYVAANDPDYQRYIYHIEIAMMTGKPAGGKPTDPWYGKKFKPLMKVNISDIRKAKIVVAKKSSRTKITKSEIVGGLNLVPATSGVHNYSCKDCKALDALAHANAVIDKLIK